MPFTFKNREKAVALFIITGIFLLLMIIILVAKGSNLFTFKTKYFTYFNDTHGFTGGTNIDYKGVPIGKIQNMNLEENNRIIAEIYIYRKFLRLINKTTVLKIQSSFFGASGLTIINANESPESAPAPGAIIFSSDMIEGQEILQQLSMSKATPIGDELTSKINTVLDDVHNIAPAIDSTLLNISMAIGNLNIILSGLRGGKPTAMSNHILASAENIAKLTENLQVASASINNKNSSIGALLNDDKNIYQKIDKILADTEKTSHNIKKITEATSPKDVENTMKALSADLLELNKLLKGLQKIFGTGQ